MESTVKENERSGGTERLDRFLKSSATSFRGIIKNPGGADPMPSPGCQRCAVTVGSVAGSADVFAGSSISP